MILSFWYPLEAKKCEGEKEPESLGKRDKPIQLNTHPATLHPVIFLPSRINPL